MGLHGAGQAQQAQGGRQAARQGGAGGGAPHQLGQLSNHPHQATRPADWVPPAGQVALCLLRTAWSQQRDQPVRGLRWCLQVQPSQAPQPPCSQATVQPAAPDPRHSTPLPAKRSKRTKAEQAAEPTQPTKAAGKGKADKANQQHSLSAHRGEQVAPAGAVLVARAAEAGNQGQGVAAPRAQQQQEPVVAPQCSSSTSGASLPA
ncbi:hypothetical protein HaLaN_14870 [Haematococcus lacustris]|uniref:Uncharacterized protein n=1 Tax=Haematococcus lacustris TaxID=44745 RepID=A0A699Z956_HAELA|nr:hypothetical protein HaLaN_14870 [Haematococcus lacustris]